MWNSRRWFKDWGHSLQDLYQTKNQWATTRIYNRPTIAVDFKSVSTRTLDIKLMHIVREQQFYYDELKSAFRLPGAEQM